jgi:hypothetical protein
MKCARTVATLATAMIVAGGWTSYAQKDIDLYSREATPFGLRQGMSVEELGAAATPIGDGMYKLTSVPKPHPGFEFYVAQVSPSTGVCYVKGVGKQVRTTGTGAELRSRFTAIRNEIGTAYGRYRSVDMLLSGSMWVGPHDWMAALAERQRLFFAQWNTETRATLRPHLTTVFVAANAKTSEAGYVLVEYYFDNEPGCQQEIDDSAEAALF